MGGGLEYSSRYLTNGVLPKDKTKSFVLAQNENGKDIVYIKGGFIARPPKENEEVSWQGAIPEPVEESKPDAETVRLIQQGRIEEYKRKREQDKARAERERLAKERAERKLSAAQIAERELAEGEEIPEEFRSGEDPKETPAAKKRKRKRYDWQ